MKNSIRSTRLIFSLLQLLSILAIAGGLWLSVQIGSPALLNGSASGLGLRGYLLLAGIIACDVLWSVAWGSFIGMCRRLQDGTSAFTRANSRTLALIGLCVTAMAGLVCIMGIAGLLQRFSLSGVILAFILPGIFLTVATLAMILRRLLDNAMALEQEQADVI